METKIVRQSKTNSCVAAVLAMMTNESEKYVLNWFEHIDPPFCDEDVFIFLAHHGIYLALCGSFLTPEEKGKDISMYDEVQINITMDKHRAYLVVDSITKPGGSHAVFWDRKHVLDPQCSTPKKLSDYKVRYIYPMMATDQRNEMEIK